ncbi:MAG: hypothetical protein SF052_04700 [Bacteroidia bacterium]|nr:hypothetical protein [Bacteroidia bacterium]
MAKIPKTRESVANIIFSRRREEPRFTTVKSFNPFNLSKNKNMKTLSLFFFALVLMMFVPSLLHAGQMPTYTPDSVSVDTGETPSVINTNLNKVVKDARVYSLFSLLLLPISPLASFILGIISIAKAGKALKMMKKTPELFDRKLRNKAIAVIVRIVILNILMLFGLSIALLYIFNQ